MFTQFKHDRPDEAKACQEKIPLKRVNKPENIASAILGGI
jgi:hypothetical protein